MRSAKRRRTISISIRDAGVIVRAPLKTPLAELDELVAAKADWIAAKLEEEAARARWATKTYASGEPCKFLGREYPLAVREAPVKRIKTAAFAGGCLAVEVPFGLDGQARAIWVRASLEKWYRPRAKSAIDKVCARWTAETGLSPVLIRVKELRRSWGVCTRDNISINWRLVMAPPALIEYVVVHELCHLKQKNHSRAFYDLLGSHLPDYKARRRELKRLAPELEL